MTKSINTNLTKLANSKEQACLLNANHTQLYCEIQTLFS
ncbi:hypothetical protein AALB_0416 [Agarivorans albus MKT 106]|uniref:Uncharacterized protein n=1 Tax=Agarivorans albus MKT 106 TaxID=1331007 RepID=R9PQI1_AGAAL|nr:hypothetical protein AALB_0416 [Agarivorans albus MKT 106]